SKKSLQLSLYEVTNPNFALCADYAAKLRQQAAQSRIRKELVMSKVRFLGLDVHADTIAVAVAEPTGEVRSLGTIPNRIESIRKMMQKLGGGPQLKACYEAGVT